MFSLPAFHRGVEKGRALIQEEHYYSLMCHGFAEVMCESGHPVVAMDMAARWHDPLSSATAGDIIDPSVRLHNRTLSMIEWVVANAKATAKAASDPNKGSFEVRALREHRENANLGGWRLDKLSTAASACHDEAQVEKEATILFDVTFKEKFPKKRRGTKEYKTLFAEKLPRARALVCLRSAEEAERQLLDVQAWLEASSERSGGHAYVGNSVRRTATSYRTVASDVEALVGEVECVRELRAVAEELEALWAEHDESVQRRIAEAKTKIAEAKTMATEYLDKE